MTDQTDRMDTHTAVFNGHVNNAIDRAKAVMQRDLSPAWVEEIEELDKQGLMSIFLSDPTPATAAFVALVTLFVNGEPTQ